MSESLNTKLHMLRALRDRNYCLFFAGQLVSSIGVWIQNLAMSWLVFSLTGSPWMLGFIAFLSQIPNFFLAPLAGVWVDRCAKRKVLLTTQCLVLFQASILTLLSLIGRLEIWHLLLLSFLLGCVNSFDVPARHAITAELIEDKEVKANAIALNSIAYNMARLIGPSLGGLLIPLIGEGNCFSVNAAGYLFATVALFYVKIQAVKPLDQPKSFWQGFKAGYQYTFGQLPLRLIIGLLAVFAFMGLPHAVLLPVYVVEKLHMDVRWLGFLLGASGMGSLAGALYLASRSSFQGLEKMLAAAGIFIGGGLAALAFVHNAYISLGIMFFVGLGLIFGIVGGSTLLQCMVDDGLRARVMSFYTMTIMGISPIGSLLAGSLAAQIGIVASFLLCGVFCIAGTVYFLLHLSVFRVQACPIYVHSGNLDSVEQCRYR